MKLSPIYSVHIGLTILNIDEKEVTFICRWPYIATAECACSKHWKVKIVAIVWWYTGIGSAIKMVQWCNLLAQTDRHSQKNWTKKAVNHTVVRKRHAGQRSSVVISYFPITYSVGDCSCLDFWWFSPTCTFTNQPKSFAMVERLINPFVVFRLCVRIQNKFVLIWHLWQLTLCAIWMRCYVLHWLYSFTLSEGSPYLMISSS